MNSILFYLVVAITLFIVFTITLFIVFKKSGALLERYFRKKAEPSSPPNPPEGVRAVRDIEYTQTPQGSLVLDVYIPEKATDKPFPVVIYFFGGGWQVGNKNQVGQMNELSLAKNGYAVVSINYRKSHVDTFPAQIHDCKAAVRWIRKHAEQYNLDPNKIGAMGGSAGGHLSALLGTSGDDVLIEGDVPVGDEQYAGPIQAVVNLFGPTDMAQIEAQRLPLGMHVAMKKGQPVFNLFGGLVEDSPDLVQQANPISYIKPGMPPFLIIHGEQDRIIPIGQSEILHEALQSSGNTSELIRLKGKGHLSISAFKSEPVFSRIRDFFDLHLKG